MKNYLFPHIFQRIGWIMFVPSLILFALFFCGFFSSLEMPSYNGIIETVVNDIVILGIIIGALFIVCSKERVEDEMTKSIRLSSFLNSIYAYAILLVICTIFINGVNYLGFAILNLVLFPIVFVCNFRWEMHRYNNLLKDEE